jgi:hypothetical protein
MNRTDSQYLDSSVLEPDSLVHPEKTQSWNSSNASDIRASEMEETHDGVVEYSDWIDPGSDVWLDRGADSWLDR